MTPQEYLEELRRKVAVVEADRDLVLADPTAVNKLPPERANALVEYATGQGWSQSDVEKYGKMDPSIGITGARGFLGFVDNPPQGDTATAWMPGGEKANWGYLAPVLHNKEGGFGGMLKQMAPVALAALAVPYAMGAMPFQAAGAAAAGGGAAGATAAPSTSVVGAGAGTTSTATNAIMQSALTAAEKNAAINAVAQLITTGKIDPESVVKAAAKGTLGNLIGQGVGMVVPKTGTLAIDKAVNAGVTAGLLNRGDMTAAALGAGFSLAGSAVDYGAKAIDLKSNVQGAMDATGLSGVGKDISAATQYIKDAVGLTDLEKATGIKLLGTTINPTDIITGGITGSVKGAIKTAMVAGVKGNAPFSLGTAPTTPGTGGQPTVAATPMQPTVNAAVLPTFAQKQAAKVATTQPMDTDPWAVPGSPTLTMNDQWRVR